MSRWSESDLTAYRIFVRKQAFAQAFANHGNARGMFAIVPGKFPARQNTHTHDAEEIRSDYFVDHLQKFFSSYCAHGICVFEPISRTIV